MFVIVSRFLIPKGYRGLTVFPVIIVGDAADRENQVLINHERIHLRQQLELLIVFFFLWYAIDFITQWLRYRNWGQAYRNIVFEREAYAHEKDLGYLKTRRIWAFTDF